jgi:uncharacterized membrane-anchored protein YhcB (DUF1043 family)
MKVVLILIGIIVILSLIMYILIRRLISQSRKLKQVQAELNNEREKAKLKKQLYSGSDIDNFNKSIELLSQFAKPP